MENLSDYLVWVRLEVKEVKGVEGVALILIILVGSCVSVKISEGITNIPPQILSGRVETPLAPPDETLCWYVWSQI